MVHGVCLGDFKGFFSTLFQRVLKRARKPREKNLMLYFQQVKSVVEVPKFALEGLSSAEFTALRSDFHAFRGENAL